MKESIDINMCQACYDDEVVFPDSTILCVGVNPFNSVNNYCVRRSIEDISYHITNHFTAKNYDHLRKKTISYMQDDIEKKLELIYFDNDIKLPTVYLNGKLVLDTRCLIVGENFSNLTIPQAKAICQSARYDARLYCNEQKYNIAVNLHDNMESGTINVNMDILSKIDLNNKNIARILGL